MVRLKAFLTGPVLTLSAAVAVSLSLAAVTFADTAAQPIGHVIAVKQSGYATRLQQSVKHTIKVGDPLYSGDQIDVKAGNTVQISLDADKENIIHIQGDSLIQITKDRAINLDLSHGHVFALLDKLETGTRFRVITPTAVSTVRGTYFGVEASNSATETRVYRGEVGVNGRQVDGRSLGTPISVHAGDKTSVTGAGTQPEDPRRMSAAEYAEINMVIGTLSGLKQPLSYSDLGAEKAKAAPAKSGDNQIEINKNSKKIETDEDSEKGGKVVF